MKRLSKPVDYLRPGVLAGQINKVIRFGWPQLAGLGIAFLAGLAIYLIQLIRMLRTFPLTELMGAAAGVTFLRGSLALTPSLLLQSGLLYLLFWAYQFGVMGLIGGYGWWVGRQAWPALWQKTAVLFLVYLLFGLVYRVSDQFAFFMAAHLFWAIAMGMGVAFAQKQLAPRWQATFITGATLLVMAMPLLYQVAPGSLRRLGLADASFDIPPIGVDVRDGLDFYLNPNRRGDRNAEQFGRQTLTALPPDALVLAHWYSDTDEYFVLRYFIAVEGLRPDVTVMGWPTADPFTFDPLVIMDVVETAVAHRPIYLASLNPQFYPVSQLAKGYCIFPDYETNLYRLQPHPPQKIDQACWP